MAKVVNSIPWNSVPDGMDSFWDSVFSHFPNRKILFHPRRVSGSVSDVNYILKNHKKYDLIIIDNSYEYLSFENNSFDYFHTAKERNDLINLYNKIDTPTIIFTSEPNVSVKQNVKFLPSFYFDVWLLNKPLYQSNKTYKLSCLNRLARPNRAHIFTELFDKPYFNNSDFLFTFKYIVTNEDFDNQIPIGAMQWYFLPEYVGKEKFLTIKKKFLSLYKLLPINPLDEDINLNDHSVNHPAYLSSVANLITETMPYGYPFFTEKTFKPLAAGMPFFIHNGSGSVKLLKEMGFDTYDDILDNSYDDEPDYGIRTSKLLSAVDNFMEKDVNIDPNRQQHNIEHFFSKSTYKKFFDQVIHNIEETLDKGV